MKRILVFLMGSFLGLTSVQATGVEDVEMYYQYGILTLQNKGDKYVTFSGWRLNNGNCEISASYSTNAHGNVVNDWGNFTIPPHSDKEMRLNPFCDLQVVEFDNEGDRYQIIFEY